MLCDNYSGFRSSEFVKFLNTHSIIQPVSSPYRSRARSIVKIYNQIIQKGLKTLTLHDREKWEDIEVVSQTLIKRINNFQYIYISYNLLLEGSELESISISHV